MQDQTPAALSNIEILDILRSMKDDVLNAEANDIIREGGKQAVKKHINKHWLHYNKALNQNLLKQLAWHCI